MSWSIDPAAPQRIEPTMKITIPARKIFLRPYMSAKRPQSGMVAISEEQVRGEHPRVVVEAVQVADHRRHRGGDDGAVE